MTAGQRRSVGLTPRRDCGLSSYERVLTRAGFGPVAGIDEAGRGACAGPLVVAAIMLKPSRVARLTELADSKALTARARNTAYKQVMDAAIDWNVVIIPPGDIDRIGLHVCNIAGMRRALAGLTKPAGYVLTDGFAVRGMPVPALAMWKGDQVAACVAAASVIAKVTRDALMCELDDQYPDFGFSRHKGYSTRSHMIALKAHGPCPEHRRSFVNVRGQLLAGSEEAGEALADVDPGLGDIALIDPEAGLEGAAAGLEDSAAVAEKSGTANSCYLAGSGQNGPIVDAIEEYGWPTAGIAAMARGA